MRAFQWHQACMSSIIIHWGVAIPNIENMTFRKRLPKFGNGLIVIMFHFALILITCVSIELFEFWQLFWTGKMLLHICETGIKSWKKSDLTHTPPPHKGNILGTLSFSIGCVQTSQSLHLLGICWPQEFWSHYDGNDATRASSRASLTPMMY